MADNITDNTTNSTTDINKDWIPPLVGWLKKIESLNYQWSLTGYDNAKLGSSGLFCKLATIFQNYYEFDKDKLYHTIQKFKTVQGIYQETRGRNNIIAECRQAMAGLINLGYKIEPFDISKYYQKPLYFMNNRDWNTPYATGAQLSHYLFFCGLQNNKSEINKVLLKLRQYQRVDGWYNYRPRDSSQIINGIMKIMTGFDVIGLDIPVFFKRNILNYLFKVESQTGGCNIYDYVYVLTKCMEIEYKMDICKSKLMELYQRILKHQQEDGGFSFDIAHSKQGYYGNRITNGTKQGDIHGTTVFCMALIRIDKYLNLGLNLVLPIS